MRRSLCRFWVAACMVWAPAANAQVSVQVGNNGDVQVFTNGSNVSVSRGQVFTSGSSISDGQVFTTNDDNTVIQRSYSYQSYGNPHSRPIRRKHRTIVRSGSGIVDQSVLIDVR